MSHYFGCYSNPPKFFSLFLDKQSWALATCTKCLLPRREVLWTYLPRICWLLHYTRPLLYWLWPFYHNYGLRERQIEKSEISVRFFAAKGICYNARQMDGDSLHHISIFLQFLVILMPFYNGWGWSQISCTNSRHIFGWLLFLFHIRIAAMLMVNWLQRLRWKTQRKC